MDPKQLWSGRHVLTARKVRFTGGVLAAICMLAILVSGTWSVKSAIAISMVWAVSAWVGVKLPLLSQALLPCSLPSIRGRISWTTCLVLTWVVVVGVGSAVAGGRMADLVLALVVATLVCYAGAKLGCLALGCCYGVPNTVSLLRGYRLPLCEVALACIMIVGMLAVPQEWLWAATCIAVGAHLGSRQMAYVARGESNPWFRISRHVAIQQPGRS